MDSLRLRRVLDGAHAEIEAGLAEAETELEALEERRSQLLVLIGRARAALGDTPSPSPRAGDGAVSPAGRPLTLHEAMAQVLRSGDNTPMAARDLATVVNERRLYCKRDGSAVEVNQIHARVHNYGKLFEKVGPLIRLRVPS